jgi:hypothetical protein
MGDLRQELVDARPWNRPLSIALDERLHRLQSDVVEGRVGAVSVYEDVRIDGNHPLSP